MRSDGGATLIRVFVSSNYRDMGADRDELMKRTFPSLRRLCASRGVTWDAVDLRWGITDEQKAEGQVLPICLAEIDRSRPYFVGLLGERYGWVPEAIGPPELLEQYPWLAEYSDRSMTELEFLHGALKDPTMADGAFFYLRDPAYIDTLLPDERAAYREPSEFEVSKSGLAAAEGRIGGQRGKLADLKARIVSSGLPVRLNYPDPHALGDLVLADFMAVVDRLYPA